MVPLGLAMPMGDVVGLLLMTAADTVQKCAVLPLSAMAIVSGGMIVGGRGGPNKTVEELESESLKTLGGITQVCSKDDVIGSPHHQLDVAGLAAAASWRGRPEVMVLFPPRMRKAVASSMCPVPLFKHVREVWFRFELRPCVQQ